MRDGALRIEEVEKRYPRLLKAMRWVGILSMTEAASTLRDYRYVKLGMLPPEYMRWGGCEAVEHWGGPLAIIRKAATADVRATVRHYQ